MYIYSLSIIQIYANKFVKKFGLSLPILFLFDTFANFILLSNSPFLTIDANSAQPPIHSPPMKILGNDVAPESTNFDNATRVSDASPPSKNHSLPNYTFVYSYPDASNIDNASVLNGDSPYV